MNCVGARYDFDTDDGKAVILLNLRFYISHLSSLQYNSPVFKQTKVILPLSLLIAGIFAFFEKGDYLFSFLPAALILFIGISALYKLWDWAGKPRSLLWMLSLALLLRLVLAVVFYVALPVNGYPDSEQQRAGYVFFDAFRRDTQAWDLASSDQPLIRAFSKDYSTDQYGGLLAFSAGVYRFLSPDVHRPLLIALIGALVATLGIPFFWQAAKELGGEKLAIPATAIFAFYPESILVASSQMREPFLITFVAVALWSLIAWLQNHQNRAAQLGMGVALIGMLMVSPAMAVVTLLFLGVFALLQSEDTKLSPKTITIFAIVLILSLFLLSSALGQTKISANNPFGVIIEWTQRAILWDVYQLERGSGWVQKLFNEMPQALHLPFVAGYGMAQPVLPAAFVEPTTETWHYLAIFRALGWYALVPLLLYGLFTLPKANSALERRVWTWFGLGSWSWIIFTALRAGGDQWDNPRYRVIFIAIQALFAAWAWTQHREQKNAWLPRILTVEVIFLAFFTHWYASRYYVRFGTLSFGAMVVWILGLSALVVIWGIIQDRRNRVA